MIPTVAVVGRPNVGKSTLFNRIIGQRLSITDETPGLTRDRIYARAEWLTRTFNIVDTGGIDFDDAPFVHDIKAQTEIAIEEADVIIFTVDVKVGVTEEDSMVARMLYKADKPVILAVNKVDDVILKDALYEFYALGLGDPYPVSAAHGVGLGDVLDEVVKSFPEMPEEPYDEDTIRLCLIGRPNVGKSTLMNTLIGEERVIVSEIEGTTRDAIDSVFTKEDQEYAIIDTAGLRRRGKVYEKAEKYSVLRAMSAIERSDIALVLIDAEVGIIEQDKKVAGYAHEAGKAVIIIVNKWDSIEKNNRTMNKWEDEIRAHFQFLSYAPIIYLSALTKARVSTLYPVINRVFDNYTKRVQTSVLNDVINDAVHLNPPKSHNGGVIKVYYATQVDSRPPTFVLFVNNVDWMHFTYKRYMQNQIRKAFGFEGSPINIVLRRRD
jgi:GTP-binding protein